MSLVEQGTLGDLPYAIIRHDEMGHLCGYLGVPPSHPWYGLDYDDVEAEVHGGLTYGGASFFGKKAAIALLERKQAVYAEAGIPLSFIHRRLDRERENSGTPRNFPVETDVDLWWFGFDCAGYQDFVPAMATLTVINQEGVYRDRDFVYQELMSLATQAYKTAN